MGFLDQDTLRLSAVVWDEGTAILLKGPFSHKKIKRSFMKALFMTEFRAGPDSFFNFLVKSWHWPERKKEVLLKLLGMSIGLKNGNKPMQIMTRRLD